MDERIAFGIKATFALLAAIWGGLAPLVQALIVLMALDIGTGFLAAFINKTLSSEASYRGMAKKAVTLLLVAACYVLQPAVGLPLIDIVAGFYCAHELLSILENATESGLPVPKILRDALARLNATAGEERPGGTAAVAT